MNNMLSNVDNKVRDELSKLQDCVEKEYCYELANRISILAKTICKCNPIEESKSYENEVNESLIIPNLESNIETLNRAEMYLQSFTSSEQYVTLGNLIIFNKDNLEFTENCLARILSYCRDETTKGYYNRIMDAVEDAGSASNRLTTKDLPAVTFIEQVLTKVLSSYENKTKTDTAKSISQVKNTDTLEEIYIKMIEQLFKSLNLESTMGVNLNTRLKLEILRNSDKFISDICKVTGFNVVDTKLLRKRLVKSGETSEKVLYRVTAESLINGKEKPPAIYTQDNMSVIANYSPHILYIYHTLHDILNDRIDWESANLKEDYRLTKEEILAIESDDGKSIVDKISKVLFVVCGLNSKTYYNNDIQKRVFTDTGEEEYKIIMDTFFTGKSAVRTRVNYFMSLQKISEKLIGINNYIKYSVALDAYSGSQGSYLTLGSVLTDMFAVNCDPRIKTSIYGINNRGTKDILLTIDKNEDDKIFVKSERYKNLYNNTNISVSNNMFYNIIPHVFINFNRVTKKLYFIPVGNIYSNIYDNQNVLDDKDITLADFMYQPENTNSNIPSRSLIYTSLDEKNSDNLQSLVNITMQENCPAHQLLKYNFVGDALGYNSNITDLRIEANPDIYRKLYIKVLDENGNFSYSIKSEIYDDYVSYSNEELAEIISDISSSKVMQTSLSDKTLEKETGLINSGRVTLYTSKKFKPKDNLPTEITKGTFYGNYRLDICVDENTKIDISGTPISVLGEDLQETEISTLDISNRSIDYEIPGSQRYCNNSCCLALQFSNQPPVLFLQKFNDMRGVSDFNNLIKDNINNTTELTKFSNLMSLRDVPLFPAKETSVTRLTLISILKKHYDRMVAETDQHITQSDLTFDFVFKMNKKEILDEYLLNLQHQLNHIIENTVKPTVDQWMSNTLVSGILRNVINYNTSNTFNKKQVYSITRSDLDNLLNIILFISKCSKDKSAKTLYKRNKNKSMLYTFMGPANGVGQSFKLEGSGILLGEYFKMNTLRIDETTIDYELVTLSDLWGYNLAYLGLNSAGYIEENVSGDKDKYLIPGNKLTATLDLTDRYDNPAKEVTLSDIVSGKVQKIFDVSSGIARLFYGLNNIASTIPDSVGEIKVKKKEQDKKPIKQEGEKVKEVTIKVHEIFNVNDDTENPQLFDWNSIIDWNNSLSGTQEDKRKTFNTWMRAYITYLEETTNIIQNIYYHLNGVEKSSRSFLGKRAGNKDLNNIHKLILMASHIKVMINGIINIKGDKPTAEELFNVLFFNGMCGNDTVDRAKYYLRVHDNWVSDENSELDIADVILYLEKIKPAQSKWVLENKELIQGKYCRTLPTEFVHNTVPDDVDLKEFNNLCNKILSYDNITPGVISSFIECIDNLHHTETGSDEVQYDESGFEVEDETYRNSILYFNESMKKEWVDKVGIYDLCATYRSAYQILEFIERMKAKKYDRASLIFSIKDYYDMKKASNSLTLKRDLAMISKMLNNRSIKKDIYSIPNTEPVSVIIEKVNNYADIIINDITLSRDSINFKSIKDRALKSFEPCKENLNVREEDIQRLTTGFAKKVLSITNNIMEIDLLLNDLTVMIRESVSKIVNDFNFLDISRDAVFRRDCTNEDIEAIRATAKSLSNRIIVLECFEEYSTSLEISKVEEDYERLTKDVKLNALQINDLTRVSDKAKRNANLGFKYYLMSKQKEYFKYEDLNMVDDELLFCNNWDNTYKIPSPFSVRSVVRSIINTDVELDYCNGIRDISSGLRDVIYPSEIFDYISSLETGKEEVQYKKVLQTIMAQMSQSNSEEKNQKLSNTPSILDMYDSYACAIHTLEEGENIWDKTKSIYCDIHQTDNGVILNWLDTLKSFSEDPTMNGTINEKEGESLQGIIDEINRYADLTNEPLEKIYYLAEQVIIKLLDDSKDDSSLKIIADAYKKVLNNLPYRVFAKMTGYIVESTHVCATKQESIDLFNKNDRLKIGDRYLFDYSVICSN